MLFLPGPGPQLPAQHIYVTAQVAAAATPKKLAIMGVG